jgi:hypothetical protein
MGDQMDGEEHRGLVPNLGPNLSMMVGHPLQGRRLILLDGRPQGRETVSPRTRVGNLGQAKSMTGFLIQLPERFDHHTANRLADVKLVEGGAFRFGIHIVCERVHGQGRLLTGTQPAHDVQMQLHDGR